jgi:hypothetical protein
MTYSNPKDGTDMGTGTAVSLTVAVPTLHAPPTTLQRRDLLGIHAVEVSHVAEVRASQLTGLPVGTDGPWLDEWARGINNVEDLLLDWCRSPAGEACWLEGPLGLDGSSRCSSIKAESIEVLRIPAGDIDLLNHLSGGREAKATILGELAGWVGPAAQWVAVPRAPHVILGATKCLSVLGWQVRVTEDGQGVRFLGPGNCSLAEVPITVLRAAQALRVWDGSSG